MIIINYVLLVLVIIAKYYSYDERNYKKQSGEMHFTHNLGSIHGLCYWETDVFNVSYLGMTILPFLTNEEKNASVT